MDHFVIMPNHIHLLLEFRAVPGRLPEGSPPANAHISQFVGTLKRFTNRATGISLWQSRSYDHIVRNEQDYQNIWNDIDTNPARWLEDRFFVG